MNTNNDNSLIWMFLDNECTSLDRTNLFSKLATSTDLQQELYSAITLRKALEDEKDSLVVPFALTKSVFASAGIAAGAGSFGAGMSWLLRGSTYLGTAVASAIITFFLFNSNHEATNREVGAGDLVGSHSSHRSTNGSTVDFSVFVPSLIAFHSLPELRQNSIAEKTIASNQFKLRSTTLEREIQELRRENIGLKKSFAGIVEANQATRNQDAERNNWQDEPDATTSATSTLVLPSPSQTPINSSTEVAESPSVSIISNSQSDLPSITQLDLKSSLSNSKPFEFGFRSISTIAHYPARDVSVGESALSNLAGSLLYQVSGDHSVGVEIGQETLPLYRVDRVNSSVNFTPKSSVGFASLIYVYSAPLDLAVAGLHPLARISVGGTSFGPIIKGTLGLNYDVSSRLRMGAGMEATSLFFSTNNTGNDIQKLSLTYWFSTRL